MAISRVDSRHALSLPQVVDEIAKDRPDTTWISIPISNDIKDGYRDVSFQSLAWAVNKMSRWIEKSIGTSATKETIAFMGINDTRYIITILAALKTGYKILLTSTRNTLEGQRSLLQTTNCTKFLHTSELRDQVHSIKDDQTIVDAFEVPEFDDLLSQKEGSDHYVGKDTDDPNEPVIIIHTSGSTGTPKPISLRNGYLATVYRLEDAQTPDNRPTMAKKICDSRPIFCSLPWFHLMGLFMMMRSIFDQGPLVLPPSTISPNAETTLQLIRAAKPKHGFFPPSILEDIVETEGGLDTLATLEDIYFAGAPLSHDVGDRLAKLPNTKLQTVIGSTEAGIIDSYVTQDKMDWEWFEWVSHSGAEMQPVDDQHSELVLKPLHNNLQGAFFSFPDLDAWRTKDLYEENAQKPGLWRYKGRNDDVIVLSNGEKFGPVDLEKTVEGHPAVKGALVVGEGRFQAGLLIEPDPARLARYQDESAFIDDIWPTVEQGNESVAKHGRVWKSKIAVANETKPFVRAAKGSIVRRKTNLLYSKEIDALYHNEGFAGELEKLSPNADTDEVKALIQKAISLALPYVPKDLKDSDDLLSFGIDSLGVLGLTSALNHSMPEAQAAIKPKMVYSSPTVDGLTSTVLSFLRGTSDVNSGKSRERRMADMLLKYTQHMPPRIEHVPRQQKNYVILTGSTGSLGTYILNQLIQNPRVAKVYCLNRSASAEDRQKQAFNDRSMTPDFSKVEFLQTNFAKDRFGLPAEKYKQLLETADIFIHNAWAVDFNMSLESFEDTHIAGTWRCIDFSGQARYHPQLVFVSSIASVGGWAAVGGSDPVPEKMIEKDAVAAPQGYGESKHVTGRMLAAAAQQSGLPVTIVRVGQLAGPIKEEGVWNKQEWLPSIIASSKAIGKVPRTLGNLDTVDWVPIDVAAEVLLDLTFSRLNTVTSTASAEMKSGPETSNSLAVYHLVNPKTTTFSSLMPTIRKQLSSTGAEVEPVEYNEWLQALKQIPANKENAEKIPGLKLLDFYEGLAAEKGLPRLATEKTESDSKTLRSLEAVNGQWMGKWLARWSF